MKRLVILMLAACLAATCACGKKNREEAVPGMDPASIEAFARKAFDAISANDADAWLALCRHPEDTDLKGKPLMSESEKSFGGVGWEESDKRIFSTSMDRLRQAAGKGAVAWDSMGRAIGFMASESGFVGNIYILVTVGGRPWAIELEPTQMSRDRGRLFMSTPAFSPMSMERYGQVRDPFAG